MINTGEEKLTTLGRRPTMNAELTRKLLKLFSILNQDY
jgi:hypothetical protein